VSRLGDETSAFDITSTNSLVSARAAMRLGSTLSTMSSRAGLRSSATVLNFTVLSSSVYAPPIDRDGCMILLTDKDHLLSLHSPCDKVGEVYCVLWVSDTSVGYSANCLALWFSTSQDTLPLLDLSE
jgi:hypothetical protein